MGKIILTKEPAMEALDLSLRQRKILYMIRDRGSYITSGALADALKVSSRTVRNDIREMNLALAPYGAEILCTRSKGILFRAEDPGRIRRLSRIDVAFFTRAERIFSSSRSKEIVLRVRRTSMCGAASE